MVAKIRVLAWNIDGATYLDGSSHQAAADFVAPNPSGPWSYGYSVAGGTAAYRFIPFDNNTKPSGLAFDQGRRTSKTRPQYTGLVYNGSTLHAPPRSGPLQAHTSFGKDCAVPTAPCRIA